MLNQNTSKTKGTVTFSFDTSKANTSEYIKSNPMFKVIKDNGIYWTLECTPFKEDLENFKKFLDNSDYILNYEEVK